MDCSLAIVVYIYIDLIRFFHLICAVNLMKIKLSYEFAYIPYC